MSYTYTLNVSYNANGGSGAPAAQSFSTQSASTTSIIVSGILSTRKPTRIGYRFLHWSVSGQDYNPGDTISRSYVYDGGDQTKSVTLVAQWAQLPAASTFGTVPSSVDLDGSTQYSFNIDKSSNAHHHSMLFSLGSESALYENIDASKNVTFPLTWNNQIPNSDSAPMTVTLTTYNSSGTQIGDPVSISVIANVPANIVPTLSITHQHVNDDAVVDGWDILLQGYSKIRFGATASGVYGASISAISFSGPNLQALGTAVSAVSDILTGAGSQTWTVSAVDTRGRATSVTYTETVYAYSPPTIKYASAKRCDQDGTLNEGEGLYGKFRATVAYSSANGNNDTTELLEYAEHGSAIYTTIANSYTSGADVVFGGGLLSLDDSFDVRLTVTDALGNEAVKTIMLSSVSGFALGLKNDRARFGGVPVRPGLQIDWPVFAPNFVQSGNEYPASVSAGSTKTVSVLFDNEFSSAPNVIACIYSSQTTGIAQCSVSIWDITRTGFSLRINNGYSSARDLGAFWIAVK